MYVGCVELVNIFTWSAYQDLMFEIKSALTVDFHSEKDCQLCLPKASVS